MDIRRTRRYRPQPNPYRPRGTRVSLPPRRRVASAQTAARRSRPGCHSARAAGPASPREPPRDAFMAGQSSPTHGAAVKSSEVSGFYKKTPEDRWQVIRSFGELSDAEIETIRNTGALKFDQVDRMIENVVGAMPIPLGIAANAVNTMAEAVAPHIEQWTGGRVYLRIISNLAVRRLVRARAVFAKEAIRTEGIPGEDVVEGILEAYAFADADPFRCATHNKGIMNGVDAVVVATGNDWRAIEAGAHAYAAWKSGGYRSLTSWEKDSHGDLVGTIELPMAVGLVGGATAVRPTAKANVRLLGVKTAQELAEVIASVGLAQNFAALRALATEGIQRGHMSLHARNVAATVGAVGEEVDRVAEILVKERKVRMDRAKEVLTELRSRKSK